MRKQLLLLILCTPILLSAQNWMPIYPDEHVNFRIAGEAIVTNTLWIDSITTDGETVYHLNRIVTDCDDCIEMYSKRINQPQFLELQMRDLGGGVYQFEGPDTFRIETLAEVGESWIWDATNDIEAFVDSKIEVELSSLDDVVDSLKTIVLSDGRDVVLSKAHGIIAFLDDTGVTYEIAGIEERELGVVLPKFEDFFDWEVGRIHQYLFESQNYLDYSSSREKQTMTGKLSMVDSIFYDYEYLGNNTTYYEGTATHSFIASDWEWLEAYPNQLYSFPGDNYIFEPYLQVISLTTGMNGEIAKQRGGETDFYQEFSVFSYSTLEEDVIVPYGESFWLYQARHEIVTSNLGVEYSKYSNPNYGWTNHLIGYIIDGDTVGTIYSDQQLIPTKEIPSTQLSLNIQPNPVKDELVVSWQEPLSQSSTLECYDLFGQLVLRRMIVPGNTTIQLGVADWPNGMYVVKLSDNRKMYSARLIKQ